MDTAGPLTIHRRSLCLLGVLCDELIIRRLIIGAFPRGAERAEARSAGENWRARRNAYTIALKSERTLNLTARRDRYGSPTAKKREEDNNFKPSSLPSLSTLSTCQITLKNGDKIVLTPEFCPQWPRGGHGDSVAWSFQT
jgi:hypothetical protein